MGERHGERDIFVGSKPFLLVIILCGLSHCEAKNMLQSPNRVLPNFSPACAAASLYDYITGQLLLQMLLEFGSLKMHLPLFCPEPWFACHHDSATVYLGTISRERRTNLLQTELTAMNVALYFVMLPYVLIFFYVYLICINIIMNKLKM